MLDLASPRFPSPRRISAPMPSLDHSPNELSGTMYASSIMGDMYVARMGVTDICDGDPGKGRGSKEKGEKRGKARQSEAKRYLRYPQVHLAM